MVERLARMPASEAPLTARVPMLVNALWSGYDAASTRASLETLLAMRGDAAFQRRTLGFLAAMRARIDRLWMGTFWDAPCRRSGHVEAQRAVFATLNGLALERMLRPGMPDPAVDLARLALHVLELLQVDAGAKESR
jgi:hypothetical protein